MSIIGFPLLLIPLAICNIIVFLMPGLAFEAALTKLPLPSGAVWTISVSDVLLALGALLLLLEVVKAAKPGAKYATDHILSLLVSCCAVAEFVLLPQFGNSTFFLLATLALIDFLAGISLRSRSQPGPGRAESVANMEAAREAPTIDAAPSPAAAPIPAAASVAEAVLLDRPEPALAAQVEASPRIASPELQPGESAPPAPER
jgi:hypothetical protein